MVWKLKKTIPFFKICLRVKCVINISVIDILLQYAPTDYLGQEETSLRPKKRGRKSEIGRCLQVAFCVDNPTEPLHAKKKRENKRGKMYENNREQQNCKMKLSISGVITQTDSPWFPRGSPEGAPQILI